MNKFLVPIDFSESSKNTLLFTVQLATYLECDVELLFVRDLSSKDIVTSIPASESDNVESVENRLNKQFEDLLAEVDKEFSERCPVFFSIAKGVIVEQILKKAQEINADMIIMSGRGKINQMSNINAKILVTANRPVWLITPEQRFKPIQKIIYATSYNESDIKALKILSDIAKPYKAFIYMLHVCTKVSFQETIMAKGFESFVRSETGFDRIETILMPSENFIETLSSLAKQTETDVVVMLKEKETFLKGIFEKSMTKKLVFKTDLPILIFHEK